MTLYGIVGDCTFDEDYFTAKHVRDALAEHGDGDLIVNLNSGGGVALEGLAIYNALKNHPGKITINVDAIAASAASLIAMAGDTRVMREGALVMIHDPRAMTVGTADEHRKNASRLDTLAEQFRRIYASGTGRTEKEIGDMMSAETWMDAEQATDLGFATSKTKTKAGRMMAFDYSLYQKAPAFLAGQHGKILMTKTADDNVIEKPWAARLLASASTSGLSIADINKIVDDHSSFDDAKDALIDRMAAADINKPKPGIPSPSHYQGDTLKNPEFLAKAIEGVVVARMSGKTPEGPSRELMGKSMLDLGAMLLEASGERVSWASRDKLASRIMMSGAHSTDDFPNLLTSAGNRTLLDAYNAAQSPLKALARKIDAPDFRTLTSLRLSEMPQLDKIEEGGEITRGTRAESKESFRVFTYAKIFGLTREALINDDLGAFTKASTEFGRAAASREANELAALFTANSGNGVNLDDGNALYSTAHANKAGSGAALSVASVGAARQALREMKGLDGKTPIGVAPKHLVVGPAKETEAEQVLTALLATQVSNVNPFGGKLTLHVEPRLTGNAWRLFADPSEIATIVIAYLNGNQGPSVATREGWDTLGIEFRAVLDFGCGIESAKGTYLNPGA